MGARFLGLCFKKKKKRILVLLKTIVALFFFAVYKVLWGSLRRDVQEKLITLIIRNCIV